MNYITNNTIRPSQSIDAPEVDVTPIMNLMVILIPFLVSMAVFTHLSVLRFSLPSNAGAGTTQNNQKPELRLTVVVAEKYCVITHGELMLDSVFTGKNHIGESQLGKLLEHHNSVVDMHDEVIVAVRNSVEFERVVEVMDCCRTAGFNKIGLSNATDNPENGA